MADKTEYFEPDFRDLLERFEGGAIAAEAFEPTFIAWFAAESDTVSDSVHFVLDELNVYVDRFCADAALRDENDIDEVRLRAEVHRALDRIRALS